MREFITPGNIMRDHWPIRMSDNINLYLGSGRMGASFDAYGLMGNGFRKPPASEGKTSLMHAEHWHRGGYGIESRLHAARVVFADGEPSAPENYRQHLSLYDGRLTTSLRYSGFSYTLASCFNPEKRDILAMELSYQAASSGVMPSLLLYPEITLPGSYGDTLAGIFEVDGDVRTAAVIHLRVGTADSAIAFRVISTAGTAGFSTCAEGIRADFSGMRGSHMLLIGIAGWERRDELVKEMLSITNAEQYAAEASEAWHTRYGNAAISVPVPEYQALWARSLYYTLASYGPDKACPAPPCGWSGNIWRYAFPQDLSYIHPALLRLGHIDIARSWTDFFHSFIDEIRAYTKRIYKADGTMWAWEFPIGHGGKLLDENDHGKPNWYQYEIHNAAYVARMAYETSLYLNDAKWTRSTAWPVVKATAEFFASVVAKDTNGRYSIDLFPSMGQDEMAGENKKNYLCALFAAEYSITTALIMAKAIKYDGDTSLWRKIVSAGLNYDALVDPKENIAAIYQAPLAGTFGRQKHPVQLNPLVFLPLGKPSSYTANAYRRRYDICRNAKENTFYGWTLATFWLASSHMGDADGLLDGLARARIGNYVDANWQQIYETSRPAGSFDAPEQFLENPWDYYVTSHGLYLQAMNDALVHDYFGKTVIGAACPDIWRNVSFQNLRTRDGSIISGEKTENRWRIKKSAV
ncbi:MAG: hypothetical protein HZC28_03980 [Spirochaetes bacterium]|nr:hypothetical protein [Spirochaetota bacterium]